MPGIRTLAPDFAVQFCVAIGRVVSRRRRARGRTQEELASACGLEVTYVRSIESGARDPAIYTLWVLAGGLDLTFAELASEIEAEVAAARADAAGSLASGA